MSRGIILRGLVFSLILTATSGCIIPQDYSYQPLFISRPIMSVPIVEGDHVFIQRFNNDPVNLKVVDVNTETKTVYGWVVPDGKLPWMVEESKRLGVIVDFADIESIHISKVDSQKVAGDFFKTIGEGIFMFFLMFAISG